MVGKKDQSSKMTWGGYDLKKYLNPGSSFKFHQLNQTSAFWLTKLDHVSLTNSVNPKADKQYTFGNNSEFIIDSGTTFTMMPSKEVYKF